jgi:hypothetical protein
MRGKFGLSVYFGCIIAISLTKSTARTRKLFATNGTFVVLSATFFAVFLLIGEPQ